MSIDKEDKENKKEQEEKENKKEQEYKENKKEQEYKEEQELKIVESEKVDELPMSERVIKESLKLHVVNIIAALLVGLMGITLYLLVTMAGYLSHVALLGQINIDTYLKIGTAIITIFFAPWGLLFAPMRYSYIKGLVDIQRGKEVEYFYYFNHFKEIRPVIKLEVLFVIIAYILSGINIVWGTRLFTALALCLLYITRVSIMFKIDNKEKRIKEAVDDAFFVVTKEWRVVLLIVALVSIKYGIEIEFEKILGGNTVINFVVNIFLAYIYVKNTKQVEEGRDERREVGI